MDENFERSKIGRKHKTLLVGTFETTTIPTRKLKLVMVGDGLIHSALYADAEENGGYNFYKKLELIKPIVKQYDLAYYNQESILGGTSLGLSTYPSFNSPQEFGDAMIDAGFNIVSLANNHTLDRGNKAIINSREYWNSKEGIMVNGSATSQEERDNIQIMEKNGISYAMLSYTTTTNGIRLFNNYCVNFYDKDKVHEEIQKVRSQVDVLMVAMHWGEEYYTGVRNEQKEIAEYLASEGVDIVIGAHPHVIEPAQYIGDTFVIYSLGNFISGQDGTMKKVGLLA
jgi:poly-gamma-glutamate synthesis protein (capsule biosynthesis protein)